MLAEFKVAFIFAAKFVISRLQLVVSRYLVKTHISPKEISFWHWFSPSFLKHLTVSQVLALLGIASFTLLTFPLGVWMGSFGAQLSFPLTGAFSTALGMIMIPVEMWLFHRSVGEIAFNTTTLIGLVLVEVASVIAVVGWIVIYRGCT